MQMRTSKKYDGFHVTQPTDSRPPKSKVKPRAIPTAATPLTDVSEDPASEAQEIVVPPPTTIPSMQAIGTQLCAIPVEELTIAALTKEKEGSASSN